LQGRRAERQAHYAITRAGSRPTPGQSVLAPPRVSPHVRAAIRERVRHERRQFWSDLLPDAVHFASCAVVTLIALAWLPLSAPVVLGIGVLGTLFTHAVLTAFHESLDAADDLVS